MKPIRKKLSLTDLSVPTYGYEQMPEIPRVKNLSQEQFEREYYDKQLPVIIEDTANRWKAEKKWTFQYFKSKWGGIIFEPTMNLPKDIAPGFVKWEDYTEKMSLAEFIDLLDDPPYPCYLRQTSIDNYHGLENDFDFDMLDTRTSQSEQYTYIWMQSSFVNSTLHFDIRNNFIAQIFGQKRVTLYPPNQSKHLYQFEDTIRYSKVVPNAPDFEQYPNFIRAKGMKGILNPGDALFIPIRWWHHLCSLDKSISLNNFYGPSWGKKEILTSINTAGPLAWYELLRDFVLLGILKHKRPSRGMAAIPIGFYIYGLTADYIRCKLRVLTS